MVQRADRPKVSVVLDREEAEALGKELLDQELVSYDTEWYDYDKSRYNINNGLIFCAQFCYRTEDGQLQLVFMMNHGEAASGSIHYLDEWLRREDRIKLCHNIPADWHATANHGIVGGGFKYDTMVMDHLLDENREDQHKLKECAFDFLGTDRPGFSRTFGTPMLTKKGQPYADGRMIVPTLPEFIGDAPYSPDDTRWRTLIDYTCDDAWDALMLFEQKYYPELQASPWINDRTMWDYYCEVDSPITQTICKMERRGVTIDVEFLLQMSAKCKGDLAEMEAKALEWARCPMNIGSGPQLAKLLYGKGPQPIFKGASKKNVLFYINGRGWPVQNWTNDKKDTPSTRAEDLKALRKSLQKTVPAEELVGFDYILNFKKYEKQNNTYLEGIPAKTVGGRFSERINQIGTTSGRFSMSTLMLIPTGDKDVYHIRDGVIAPPGYNVVVFDWVNLEYRLLAHFSQEPVLINLFEKGLDLHSMTTYNIFPHVKAEADERFGEPSKEALTWIAETYPNERKRGKTLNFEIIYGVGASKLGEQLGIAKVEAQQMIDNWFKGYPCVKVFNIRLMNEFRVNGFSRMLDGRPRHANMDKLNSTSKYYRGEEERTLQNAKIQGSAAAMAKKAMIRVAGSEEIRKTGYELLLQVHDELLGICPIETTLQAIELIRPIMEQPFSRPLRLRMPVSVGYGPSWASAKV